MTPALWFQYVLMTMLGLAIGGLLALVVWVIWHVTRGWLEVGAVLGSEVAVGAAVTENTE